MKKNIILILGVILFITACHKDYKIYDKNNFKSQLVIHSLAAPDSILRVFVTKSAVPEQLDTNCFVTNATVSLYEDDNFIENLVFFDTAYVEENSYYDYMQKEKFLTKYYKSNYHLKRNHSYSIKIKAEGKEADANFSFPQISAKVEVDKNGFTCDTNQNSKNFYIFFGQGTMYFKLKTTKHNGHYMLRLLCNAWDIDQNKLPENYTDVPDSAYYKTAMNISFIDNSEENGASSLNSLYATYPFLTFKDRHSSYVFTDLSDNNTINITANMNFQGYKRNGEPIYIKYQLFEISDKIYKYYSSLDKYWDSDGNPFVEPVNVYSNVEGGFGFVGAYNVTEDSIKIDIKANRNKR